MRLQKWDKILIGLIAIAIIVSTLILISGTIQVSKTKTIIKDNPVINTGSAIITGSIVDADIVYTKANLTSIESFFQTAVEETIPNSPLASEKFGISADAILFDSNQKQFPNNFILLVPKTQTLVDKEGRLLDLGSIQISLTGITEATSNVIVDGKIKVFLDSKLVIDTNIAGIGRTQEKQLPLSIGGKKTFTFTFADEGKTWIDESTHYFKVILYNINAVTGEGFDSHTFKFPNEAIIYLLEMKVDTDKIVVKDTLDSAISIFKADSILKACGVNQGRTQYYDPNYKETRYRNFGALYPPIVEVITNGVTIVKSVNPTYGGRDADFGAYVCNSVSGIPRNAIVTFKVDNQEFKVLTPKTVNTYQISCTYTNINTGTTKCVSTFGWGA